ncbi:hypothetical protein GOP47_0027779 [Adiantum capillus-veneris]|nr:hypothetical protein GOP47_0027779 [Adiantum capillus-veneris]
MIKRLEGLGSNVEVFVMDQGHPEGYALRAEEIEMLKSREEDLSYTFVQFLASIIKSELNEQFQLEVFILDCAISQVLNARKAPKELLPWFTYCPERVRLVVFPYCSRRHWSLAIIDIQEKYTLYFNSLPETIHSEIKKYLHNKIITSVVDEKEKMSMQDYTELDLLQFRMDMIEDIVDRLSMRS